jgi:hypothetical protein
MDNLFCRSLKYLFISAEINHSRTVFLSHKLSYIKISMNNVMWKYVDPIEQKKFQGKLSEIVWL